MHSLTVWFKGVKAAECMILFDLTLPNNEMILNEI